jgi:hypothetical protein
MGSSRKTTSRRTLSSLLLSSWTVLLLLGNACAIEGQPNADDDAPSSSNPAPNGSGGAPTTGSGQGNDTNLGSGGDTSSTTATTGGQDGQGTTTGAGGSGSGSGNDCCANNQTPGCQDAAVEACVCALDAYCCDTAWDDVCAGMADNDCGHSCGGQGSGGSGSSSSGSSTSSGGGSNPPPGCEQCILQQCGLQCVLDGTCGSSLDLLVFDCLAFTCSQACFGWDPPGGGSGSSGSGGGGPSGACCVDSATPGCADTNVESCVCAQDAYCCNTAWDATCVMEVSQFGCGSC